MDFFLILRLTPWYGFKLRYLWGLWKISHVYTLQNTHKGYVIQRSISSCTESQMQPSTFQTEIQSPSHCRKWNHWDCLTLHLPPSQTRALCVARAPSDSVSACFLSWFTAINSLLPFWPEQGGGEHWRKTIFQSNFSKWLRQTGKR